MARWTRRLGPVVERPVRRRVRLHGRPHGGDLGPIPPRSPFYHGTFGRMFRNLPPLEKRDSDLAKLASTMDEPKDGEHDPKLDNPRIPAAYTYLGQFVDHDITFDPTSDLQRRNDPDRLENFRTPRFDLDSLYGRGPEDVPYLYDKGGSGKFLVGPGANKKEQDLPRNAENIALIGDPRNDENTIVSQLQLALILFHNHLIGDKGEPAFLETQRTVQWHYQWIVVHDFLKRVVDEKMVDEILEKGRRPGEPLLRFYEYEEAPFIPVEFSGAAYRFGHSMIRRAYHLNDPLDHVRRRMDKGNIPLFVPKATGKERDIKDLRGRKRLPGCWTIQWDRFLDITRGKPPQFSRRIDTKLAPALKHVPDVADPGLAFRSLKRGVALGLPSGQSVARAMGHKPIPSEDRKGEDPLWYYVLREAEVQHQGRRLGEVGGRIVAEVLIGLMAGDPQSYLRVEPSWTPTLPSRVKGSFELADLLRIADVPLTAGDLPFTAKNCEGE